MNDEHPECPKCGATDVACIMYGFPDFTDELNQELDARRTVLGGCTVTGDDPEWHCNECHHEW